MYGSRKKVYSFFIKIEYDASYRQVKFICVNPVFTGTVKSTS